ncbi:MAG: hypothetical protein O2856_19195, partial [Planctomycetota bacterium]|nr:hypothetical protein [Planctomycetota bacterium]
INLSPFNIRWRDTICNLAGSGDLRKEESAAVRFAAGPINLRDVSYLASRFSNRPLPVSGTAFASGGINVNLRQLTYAAGGDLTLLDAQYANTRIGDSRLFWKANPQAARLQCVSDNFFGGSYVVDATLQSLDWSTTTVAASGQNIEIGRLAGILGNELPVSGFIDGSVHVGSIGELATLRADGWVRTREASLAGTPLELQTTMLSVSDGVANVAFRGAVLESQLEGDASTRLADLSAWLAPIPGISDSASGAVSFSISGRLGSTSTATARVAASNIEVGGLMIRKLRFPIVCSFQSQSSQVRWQSRGGSLNVGGGNVTINSEGSLTNGLATMATSVDIRHVDTAKLMPGKSISAGIIDGTVNLQSKRANEAKDLTGRFHLELSRIQMLELPGSESLMQLVNLPTFSGPSRAQDDGGSIDGRLAGGLLHVDTLALSKSGVLLLMSGTSTLEGRLDFDVIALTTQTGPADGLFALSDSPLMLAAPAPVTLLIKANEAIKDRIIHIHVGGTGARPALRLQPGKTLSQDALRFFVAGTLGNRTADLALRQQRQSVRY